MRALTTLLALLRPSHRSYHTHTALKLSLSTPRPPPNDENNNNNSNDKSEEELEGETGNCLSWKCHTNFEMPNRASVGMKEWLASNGSCRVGGRTQKTYINPSAVHNITNPNIAASSAIRITYSRACCHRWQEQAHEPCSLFVFVVLRLCSDEMLLSDFNVLGDDCLIIKNLMSTIGKWLATPTTDDAVQQHIDNRCC